MKALDFNTFGAAYDRGVKMVEKYTWPIPPKDCDMDRAWYKKEQERVLNAADYLRLHVYSQPIGFSALLDKEGNQRFGPHRSHM